MLDFSSELRDLRERNPDVSLLLDRYAELERIYQASLEAMGYQRQPTPQVSNSAEVVVPFTSDATCR